ncbi:hypothetical protein [Phenylobacterium sp.]|uniref:hypothetical protein n=1 Tax=Phenylobacterium sp. TaxID=1871053 RepID=UPI0027361978|nr:hypothetical protein [Phenylobacterium sp.]MDP3633045.1 hypothetical protein [Phenylobacterium sp.]
MLRTVLIGTAGLLALAACDTPLKPPTHTGVCWRLAPAMNGAQDFRPMSNSVPNLQACAIQLEGLHLRHEAPVTGAYQGQIIYVTEDRIEAAASSRARRYQLFTPEQRAEVDRGLKLLMGAGDN